MFLGLRGKRTAMWGPDVSWGEGDMTPRVIDCDSIEWLFTIRRRPAIDAAAYLSTDACLSWSFGSRCPILFYEKIFYA